MEYLDDDQQAFMDAADTVMDVTNRLDSDLAFVACGAVMLDCLEDLLETEEDKGYVVSLANQIHVEFMSLMSAYGYELSDETEH